MEEKYPNYNPNIKTVICRNVKKYRKEKGVRLMTLAEELGLSVEYLKRIEAEHDRDDISLLTLYKISILLDTPIEKFFTE